MKKHWTGHRWAFEGESGFTNPKTGGPIWMTVERFRTKEEAEVVRAKAILSRLLSCRIKDKKTGEII